MVSAVMWQADFHGDLDFIRDCLQVDAMLALLGTRHIISPRWLEEM